MRIRSLLLILFSAISLSSCLKDGEGYGGDDEETAVNVNANDAGENAYLARMEFPRVRGGGDNIVVVHSTDSYGVNYAVEWDCAKRAQRWTCFEMNAANSVVNWARNNWYSTEWGGDPFQIDPDLPEDVRTEYADYRGSGYTRGHMVASADRLCSREVNEQTFYYSNMQPQMYSFNGGIWASMEAQVRRWNKDTFRTSLYVCRGGTIDSAENIRTYTSSGLPVPKYFFMAILCKNNDTANGGYKALAFWIEHRNDYSGDENLAQFVISIDDLEEKTGIDFFCNLPDDIENAVEANVYPITWGLK